MLTLSKTNQILIGLVIALLVIATRGHHFASIEHLPSISLAAFFLIGLYLRPLWAFPALLGLCAALDLHAVTYAGVSNFCVTPAYGFLLPAYGTMWLAGRWLAKHYSFTVGTLLRAFGLVAVAAAVSELFSSGGFYFFGGRYADPTLAEFGTRLVKYFPYQVESLAFWLGIALVTHVAFALVNRADRAKA